MQAVILAGGKGTRLGSILVHIPKPLVPIGAIPVLEHQIKLLKKYAITDIILLTGHLAGKIYDYFGDGSRWGVSLTYIEEPEPMGTAGALRQLRGKVQKDFLVLSGDVMMDFDVARFIAWHGARQDSIVSAVVHPSDHPFDSDLVEVDDARRITSLLTRPHPEDRLFQNIGIASVFILSPDIFRFIPTDGKYDLEKHIFPKLLAAGKPLYAYNTPEYLRDMGTPERLAAVTADYHSGAIHRRNLSQKRPAIFLDRDGVINEEVDKLSRPEDLKLYKSAAQAIRQINASDYFSIVITNQPAIAKGFLTELELKTIHKKMETELGKVGAKIDAIYYCPHHPDKGFPGEVPELKVECACRKPGTAMIMKAVAEFNIDLEKSYMIGDSTRDAKTAENAGIRFVGVGTGYALQDESYKLLAAPLVLPALSHAVDHILFKTKLI